MVVDLLALVVVVDYLVVVVFVVVDYLVVVVEVPPPPPLWRTMVSCWKAMEARLRSLDTVEKEEVSELRG